MKGAVGIGWAATLLALGTLAAQSQQPVTDEAPVLTETGQLDVGGHAVNYVIHRLPVSSFPDMPFWVTGELARRGCMIPQTWSAHRPENAVHGSFEQAGSNDWAVLCSAQGQVTLLVFFASHPGTVQELASQPEVERLQPWNVKGDLGFNWAIDPATPQRVHDAQSGMSRRPARPDHDALADATVDRRTLYRFFTRGRWTLLDMPE